MIKKKKIIIFGASGGLGDALVKILDDKFFSIFLFNRKNLNFLKKNSEKLIKKNIMQIKPDVIVNCAGVLGSNSDNFEKIYRINLMPNWEIIKLYKKLKSSKKVLFIIIGSSSYKKGHKDYILYSSSKSALQNMYEGGLEFLRNTNLKLEMIHPKRINTNMVKHLVRQNSTNVLTPISVAKKIYKIIKNN